MLITNPRAERAPYPADLHVIMNTDRARSARQTLASWRLLNPGPTPLIDLPDLAQANGLARLAIKDEARRSPLGSFKALGAPIALVNHLLRTHPELEPSAVLQGHAAEHLRDDTVISATDGNHGRALAAAAHSAGCRCVIVLHAQVSQERERAIADWGAQIVRITGNYDDSVREAARLADSNGWQVISDTSYEGFEVVPRDVMQGYSTIAEEVIEPSLAAGTPPFEWTHVFLQGGVGGLAAGVASDLWERLGPDRPVFVVVEPEQADCLMQSARLGAAARATGSVDSVMAGLACGETSPLAWRFLQPCIDAFMTISDEQAVAAMQLLARGSAHDAPLVVGESGVAGLAGLLALRGDAQACAQIGLDRHARVLVINTEGATAESVYEQLVGETASSVMARQQAWRARQEKSQ